MGFAINNKDGDEIFKSEDYDELAGFSFHDLDLTDADFGEDFSNIFTDVRFSRCNLTGATFENVNLNGVTFKDCNLNDVCFEGAKVLDIKFVKCTFNSDEALDDLDLRAIKADIFYVLRYGHNEVPTLLSKLRDGEINGDCYQGPCSCLVGTICYAQGITWGNSANKLPTNVDSPAEQWFMGILPGDRPDNSLIAKLTEGWILDYLGYDPARIQTTPITVDTSVSDEIIDAIKLFTETPAPAFYDNEILETLKLSVDDIDKPFPIELPFKYVIVDRDGEMYDSNTYDDLADATNRAAQCAEEYDEIAYVCEVRQVVSLETKAKVVNV